jgi:MFS family permease
MTSLSAAAPSVRTAPVVWLVLFGSFWIKCATYFSIPFLTIFLSRHTTLSLPVIGLLVGLQPLANAAGGFLGGHLSDRLGRRAILSVSLAGTTLAYLGFYFVAAGLMHSAVAPLGFAVLNLLAGWFASFFWPVTQALIADVSSEDDRRRIYRHRYVMANVGGACGPLLAATLGFAAATQAFLATAALYAVLLAAFVPMLRAAGGKQDNRIAPRRSLGASLAVLAGDGAFRYLLLSAILFGIAYAQIESNLSQLVALHFDGGVRLFSYLLAVNALGVLLLQPLSRRVEHWLPPRPQTALGTVVFCAGCLLLAAFTDSRAALFIGIAIVTAGEVLVVPTLSVLIDEIAPPILRGTYFGAAGLRQLGPALGPALGGVFVAHGGAVALFVFMTVIAGSSLFTIRCSLPRAGKP